MCSTRRFRRRADRRRPGGTGMTDTGVRPNNETLFLLNLLAYEILHMGRNGEGNSRGVESAPVPGTDIAVAG